jgi:hypothetical protein
MADASGTPKTPTRGKVIFASVVVVLTVAGLWKFIDYRTQPPPPPSRAPAGQH